MKWPNDLLVKGKKIAGILVDASLTSNQVDHIVLGVGINFDVPIKTIEKNIKNTGNYSGVSSLIKSSKTIRSVTLVQSFLNELENIFESLKIDDGREVLKKWTKK